MKTNSVRVAAAIIGPLLLVLGLLHPSAQGATERITLSGNDRLTVDLIGFLGTSQTGSGAGGDSYGNLAVMGCQLITTPPVPEACKGVNVIDISDPRNPQILSTFPQTTPGTRMLDPILVDQDGDGVAELVLVANQGDSQGALILDISNPAMPVKKAFFAVPGGGVHTLQIDPEDPTLAYLNLTTASLGEPASPANPNGQGGHVILLDISNPAMPTKISVLRVENWNGRNSGEACHDGFPKRVGNRKLYYCAYLQAGIVVFDVTDPTGPFQVGRGDYCPRENPESGVPDPPLLGAEPQPRCSTHNIVVTDNLVAYVGDEIFTTPGLMHVVDVRNPAAMREIARIMPPTFDQHKFQPGLSQSEVHEQHRYSAHNFYFNDAQTHLAASFYGAGLIVFDISQMSPDDTDGRNLQMVAEFHPVQGFDGTLMPGLQGTPNVWTTRFGDGAQAGCIHIFDKITGFYIVDLREPGNPKAGNSCTGD